MSFWDYLFPSRCLNCQTRADGNRGLCPACLRSIPLKTALTCGDCRGRIPVPTDRAGRPRWPSRRRTCHPHHPYLLAAATDYRDHPAIRAAIHGLKFDLIRGVAEPLGELLAAFLRELRLPTAGFLLVPIPLSRVRERRRGFNQAELLGRAVAAELGLPLAIDLLVRIDSAPPQSTLPDRAARKQNVQGCFRVARPELAARRKILLIDDVTTSGATLAEAASVLRRAGALRVAAAVVAQA